MWKTAYRIRCTLYTISRWIHWYSVSFLIVVFFWGPVNLVFMFEELPTFSLSLSSPPSLPNYLLSSLSRFSWWRKNLKRIQHLHTKTGIGFFQSSRSTTFDAAFPVFVYVTNFFQYVSFKDLFFIWLVLLPLLRKNVKQKKVKTKEKKQYTPFPPPQQPSKVSELLCGLYIF